jgi:hypothetical protein
MKRLGLFIVLAILFIFTVSCVSKEVPVTETYYETQYKTESYTETVDAVVDTKEGETYIKPTTMWSAGFLSEKVGFNYYGFEPSTTQHSKSQIKVTFSGILGIQDLKGGILAYDLTGLHQIPAPPTQETWSKGAPEIKAWFDNLLNPELTIDPKHKLPIVETQAQGVIDRELLTIDDDIQYIRGTIQIDSDPACRNWDTGQLTHVGEALGLNAQPSHFEVSSTGYVRAGDGGGTTYIVFDTTGLTEFAILDTWYMYPISAFQLLWTDEVIEKKTVTKEKQIPYQVEKQRTVMQTKKVPFWEVVFGR